LIIAGDSEEFTGLLGIQREWLLRVDVSVGRQRCSSDGRVGGVAGQIHHQRSIDGRQRRLEIGEPRTVVSLGHCHRPLFVEITHPG
jgi:hypothetical protein